jgi:hypothetical protein
MTAAEDAGQPALFGVEELGPLPNARRAEAGLARALEAAAASAVIGPVDAALAAAALIAARALDRAEAQHDKTAIYAIAQLLPPYQRALHGLRLPAEVTPVTESPVEGPVSSGVGVPSWLGDEFGPS